MSSNKPVRLANLRMLEFVASKLKDMCNDVVFLGGCTTAIFITDSAVPDVRHTLDVDCIIDVISLNAYHQVEKKLQQLGFKKSLHDDVICRWHYDEIILDVMPTDELILGFGNRWYKPAITYANSYGLSNDLKIRVASASYFLATKLEAFKERGNNDFYASHDLEDVISVIDGRSEIVKEVQNESSDLKNYLGFSFSTMIKNSAFQQALPGHFAQYGVLANERIDMFLARLNQITAEVMK